MRDRDSFKEVMEKRRGEKSSPKFRQPEIQFAEAADFEHDPAALEEFVREQKGSGGAPQQVFSGIARPVTIERDEPEEIDDSMSLVTEDQQESDTAKAICALLGKGDLRTQTELDKEEVRALSVLLEVSQKFGAVRLEDFAKNFMALMVSHDRGSRREVVQSFAGLDQFGRRNESPSAAQTIGGLRPGRI